MGLCTQLGGRVPSRRYVGLSGRAEIVSSVMGSSTVFFDIYGDATHGWTAVPTVAVLYWMGEVVDRTVLPRASEAA